MYYEANVKLLLIEKKKKGRLDGLDLLKVLTLV